MRVSANAPTFASCVGERNTESRDIPNRGGTTVVAPLVFRPE